MDKKMAILIIAVFCLLCVGSYLIFEPGRDVTYHQVNLTNSCSAKVPVSDQVSEYTDKIIWTFITILIMIMVLTLPALTMRLQLQDHKDF